MIIKSNQLLSNIRRNFQNGVPFQILFFLSFLAIVLHCNTLSAKIQVPSEQMKELISEAIDQGKSVREITLKVEIGLPASNIIEILDLPGLDPDKPIIEQPELTAARLHQAIIEFDQKKWGFSWSIVLVGMLVIFTSLLITGTFVSQIQNLHFNDLRNLFSKQKKKKLPEISASSSQTNISPNAIIAVICALNAHIQDAETQNKLELTWSREPVSLWKSTNKINLPNTVYAYKKRRS